MKYLILKDSVFLWNKKDRALFYDSATFDYVLVEKTTDAVKRFCNNLATSDNVYSIEIYKDELDFKTSELLDLLVIKKIARYSDDMDDCAIPPILLLNGDLDYMDTVTGRDYISTKNLYDYIAHFTFFIDKERDCFRKEREYIIKEIQRNNPSFEYNVLTADRISFLNDVSNGSKLNETVILNSHIDKRRIYIHQKINDNSWNAYGNRNRKWLFTISPFINIESSDGSCQFFMSSQSVTAQDIQLSPSLSRTGSAERLIGNPYLKPSTYFSATANYYKTKQVQLMCEFRVDRNAIVDANWLSIEGIRYSFPVNSKHPQISLSPFINYYAYFTKDKRCYLYFNVNGVMRFERGYQSDSVPIIDDNTFNIADFIERYWGDDNGSIFYKGLSNFKESRTFLCNMTALLDFTYRSKIMTTTFHFSPTYYFSRYSLVPEAGEKVWKIELGPSVDLRLPNEFDLSSRLEYILYKGYGKELDCGLWNLSFELNKEIGAFVLSLKCNDAFNQSKNISHIASSEYVQNVIQNRLGRTVLVSVGYLFGKGSSEKQRNSNKFVRNVTR